MRCHIGVDAASGLVHSVVSTAANVHELNTEADRVHGEERVIYGDAGHIGIEKRDAFKDCEAEMRIAMKPGQRRVLPDIPEGRLLNLIETADTSAPKWSIHFGSSNASLDSGRFITEASARTT
jgi:IS5 family transposase